MRVSKEAMAESNAKIVDKATRLFKERGLQNTSVSDVMSAAGLTHGGFYRHFNSKEDLVVTAVRKAFDDIAKDLGASIADRGPEKAIARFVEQYLSEKHLAAPGQGCPIVALGADASHGPEALQGAFAEGINRLAGLLAQGCEGEPEERRAEALRLAAKLVGALVLARSVNAKDLRTEILCAIRSEINGKEQR